MKKLIAILFIAIVYFVIPSNSYAQQCINGGVECCVKINNQCGGDTFPGSCNSSCQGECPGGEIQYDGCHWDNDGGGGGGGGGYDYPTCPSGKVLKAYSPMGKLNGGQCIQRIGCGDIFPSVFFQTGCDGKETKGECEISYLCCNLGDSITCTGSTVTRYGNCNPGEVKLSSDANGYFQCKRGCSCVPPCNLTAPAITDFVENVNGTSGTLYYSGVSGSGITIYYGWNKTNVNNLCSNSTGCSSITDNNLSTADRTQKAISGLTANRVYWFKMVQRSSSTCTSPASGLYVDVSSCQFNPITMTQSQTKTQTTLLDAITTVSNQDAIDEIRWIKTNSSSSYSLPGDSYIENYPWSVNITSQTVNGLFPLESRVRMWNGGNIGGTSQQKCTYSSSITVYSPPPPPPESAVAWWQVKDGDVLAKGDIATQVPSS